MGGAGAFTIGKWTIERVSKEKLARRPPMVHFPIVNAPAPSLLLLTRNYIRISDENILGIDKKIY